MWGSGVKPCLAPCAAFLASEEHAVVQPERPVVPELDGSGNDAEAGPVGRAGYFADGEFGRVFGDGLFQSETGFERPRLFRRPGSDAASARARGEIGVRLILAHYLHGTADAHLPAQAFPMETHGRLHRGQNFPALGTLKVGIENE